MAHGDAPELFGVLLRRHRLAAGLSQEELAERAGLSRRGVSDLERGTRRSPHPATARRLAEALGIDEPARDRLFMTARVRGQTEGTMVKPPSATLLPELPGLFVGRAADMDHVCDLLRSDDVRLLTLTGPGGVGKTRLALEAAARLVGAFCDGVFLVEVAQARRPDTVLSLVAHALGLQEEGSQPLITQVTEYLRARQLLLVVDNFEHVLEVTPELTSLLAVCPGLKLLVTSREPLHSRWERVYRVVPLELPDLSRAAPVMSEGASAAFALFVDRAEAVNATFKLTGESARAIAEICVHLDGLPLAIELAAARCSVLSPTTLLARLRQRFDVLTRGPADVPVRHRTLRAAIDWSYDLLSGPDRAVFRRLGVFVGSWSLEAAAVVSKHHELGLEVLEAIASLAEKSLIQIDDANTTEPRFRMLESVRAYALEQLEVADELADTRAAHADFVVGLVTDGDEAIRGPRHADWLDRVEVEHDNVRDALAWLLTTRNGVGTALTVGWSMGWFWALRGYYAEGLRWLERIQSRAQSADPGLRARLLNREGTLAAGTGDFRRGEAAFEASLKLATASGDMTLAALDLLFLGNVAEYRGDLTRGRVLREQSLAQFRGLGDDWGVAYALQQLGMLAYKGASLEQAATQLTESLTLSREIGDLRGLALSQHCLGLVAFARGDLERALSLQTDSLAGFRRLGFKRYIGWALLQMAHIDHERGDDENARGHAVGALQSAVQRGDKQGIADCLDLLADLSVARGDWQRAARGWGAADDVRDQIGARRPPASSAAHGRQLALAEAAVGKPTLTLWLAQGRSLSAEEAVALGHESVRGAADPNEALAP